MKKYVSLYFGTGGRCARPAEYETVMDNFIVSARKYRPATFASVVGQNHITSTLKNAIARGQLAHAYLFCGPRGVGKTTCARIFAKAINCSDPRDSEACGECESCRSFNENRSFNIHELDAASNNSVDDIRTLTEQVRIPPQIGRYSIYIIDEVHMLSASAFNAFLKTLEEPPAHAIFILATTEKHKILPTILSRCQIYDFNRIRVEDTVEYLKFICSSEGVTTDDESLHLIARKADGGMRDALSMFDKAVSFCGNSLNFKEVAKTLNVLDYDTYFNVTDLVLRGDYQSVLVEFDQVLRSGFSERLFVGGLNSHLRDLLMAKDERTRPLMEISGTLLERYRVQAEACDPQFLFNAIAVLTALDGSFRGAINQRLNAELGLMKLCGAGQKKNELDGEVVPLPELIAPSERNRVAEQPIESPVTPSASLPSVEQPAVDLRTAVAPAVALHPESQTRQAAPQTPTGELSSHVAIESIDNSSVPRATTTISGISLSGLLNDVRSTTVDNATVAPESVVVDEQCQQKIEAGRERFLAELQKSRPRFANAFVFMEACGNKVRLPVTSGALKEEIERERIEILTLLKDVCAIDGYVDMELSLSEQEGSMRPVTDQEKMAYLSGINPKLADMCRKLQLDFE